MAEVIVEEAENNPSPGEKAKLPPRQDMPPAGGSRKRQQQQQQQARG
jgi:hypothetical protein